MTAESIKAILDETSQHMDYSIDHLSEELVKVRAGRPHPSMVDGIIVNYYGTPTPLNQVANISIEDARTLKIQPWEKHMVGEIDKAILAANLGITPQNDGESVRLPIPALTEERRKDLVKQAKDIGENIRIALRNVRRDALKALDELQKSGESEDNVKTAKQRVDQIIKDHDNKVNDVLNAKEDEIMTV